MPPLTAGHRHEAHHLPGFVVEFMTFGFQGNGVPDRILQVRVADTGAQQGSEFEFVFLAQAQVQRAVDGQPDAVAGFAEVL
jgi:hypothetical protein